MIYVDIEWLLGAFRGRASRYHFLVGLLLITGMVVLAAFAFRLQHGTLCRLDENSLNGRIYYIAFVVIAVIITYSGTAVYGKRLQDRGIPGILAVIPWLAVWALPAVVRFQLDGAPCLAITEPRLMLAGVAGGLLALFTLYCLFVPGSRFGNRYGDSLLKPIGADDPDEEEGAPSGKGK